jgi:hypothetical protein
MRAMLVVACLVLAPGCSEEITVKHVAGATPRKHPMYAILEQEPRNEYERRLPLMLSKAINVDALQMFCGQWYPESGHAVADAYMEWRRTHEATLSELRGRSVAVWTSYIPNEDPGYVRMVEPHLRKQMMNAILKEFDASPAEKFRRICADFPRELRSDKWNLEKRYAKELAYLRQTPYTPPG